MASPNDGYPYDHPSNHKRPRGLVDPYEIPDSPPPPPKRQRPPLPAKRMKVYGGKQPLPAPQVENQVIETSSRHAEGYVYTHGNTWGSKQEKLILKSNGIEDWDRGTILGPADNFRDLNVWSTAALGRPTSLDGGGGGVGRSLNGGAVNSLQDRTLKIRDLVHDEPPGIAQGLVNYGLRLDTASSGMLPWVGPVANMTAPVVNMMPMNSGNGRNSPSVTPSYRSPYAMPTWEEQRQMDMAHAHTALASIARVTTAPPARASMTPNSAMQTAPAAITPYHTAFSPVTPATPAMPAMPAITVLAPAASSSVLPAPMTPNLMVPIVLDSTSSASQTSDSATLETPSSAITAPMYLASAPNPLALKVPAAPVVRAASADISPTEIPPVRGPNGVEQVARRYSLQEYSVREYSVVGSPVTRAIRVLRPGADKPFVMETSPEETSRNFVEALGQPHFTSKYTSGVQTTPSEGATSSVASFSRPGGEASADLMTDVSRNTQNVEFLAEKNNLEAARRHTPIAAQTSVSSPQSSRMPLRDSLLQQRSGPGVFSLAQIISSEEPVDIRGRIEEQMTVPYLPTLVDERSKEAEDRRSENEHQDETVITTEASTNVSRELDTEDDDLTNNSPEDIPSHSFDRGVENRLSLFPDNPYQDTGLSQSDQRSQGGACGISSDVDEEQILRELDTTVENNKINSYDSLSHEQTRIIEADMNTETRLDNVQEADNMLVDHGAPVSSQYMGLVDNIGSHSPVLESSGIVDGGAKDRQFGIQGDISSVRLDAIVDGRHTETPVTVDQGPLRADSTPIIFATNNFPTEQPLGVSNINVNEGDGNGADNSESSMGEVPAELNAAVEMEISPDLNLIDDKIQRDEPDGELDVAMEASISKAPQKSSVAQASLPETRGSSLSDVEGHWVDTYMETESSIMGESTIGNGLANENENAGVSNDGSDDNSEDEEEQVDLIQGQRIDGDGKVEFLVKWKDVKKAISWESEEHVLDLATDKLLEFFKKIVFEKIGPEVVVKSKRGPGRPRGRVNKSKRPKPSFSRASMQPTAVKRGRVRSASNQNRIERQNALLAAKVTKGRAETSESLLEDPAEEGREGPRQDLSSIGLARSPQESSSNTSLAANEAVEGYGSLSKPSTKRNAGPSRRSVSNITRDNPLVTKVLARITETPAKLSPLPAKKGRGRLRKTLMLTIRTDASKAAHVIQSPANTKEPSAIRLLEEMGDPQHGSQRNPIHLDSATSTPSPTSPAGATSPLLQVLPGRHRGHQNRNLDRANEKDSRTISQAEKPTIPRSVDFAKRGRGRGRPAGSSNKARRRPAEPTLITRIKTMARENRGRPATRLPGEVILPRISLRGRTINTESEATDKIRLLPRRVNGTAEPRDADLVSPEPESEQLEAEDSEEEEVEAAESQPQVSEPTKRKRKARNVKSRRRGVQKRTRHGRIAQPTIATRMKTMGRSNRGQPPSRLPGHIVMPWTPRRRKSRAKPLEAPEAELLTEAESGEPEPEEAELQELEPEEPNLAVSDVRPRRGTRNHLPKYQDVMRFGDLEESRSATVPVTSKRRTRSSRNVHLVATDEEPQSRTASAPTEAESGTKKSSGRRPGSGYVKDRWYYASY